MTTVHIISHDDSLRSLTDYTVSRSDETAPLRESDVIFVDLTEYYPKPFFPGSKSQRIPLEFVGEILKEDPRRRVVVLVSFQSTTLGKQAVEMGAKAYVSKPIVGNCIERAIQQALNT